MRFFEASRISKVLRPAFALQPLAPMKALSKKMSCSSRSVREPAIDPMLARYSPASTVIRIRSSGSRLSRWVLEVTTWILRPLRKGIICNVVVPESR